MSQRYLMMVAPWIAAVLLAGCNPGSVPLDPKFAADRERLLLKEEPPEPVGIMELRETGVGENQVVLFGKIGGVKGQTWSPGNAEFMLSDPTATVGGEHKADCNCLFCKNKKQKMPEPYAIVQFCDDGGHVLPVDARQLLPLEESLMVVVRGRATVDTLGNLVVAANGIFVRR